ncbi:MAG: DUF2914 domain-containing protein [Gammaproteobacteria bacterium]|nr:DUF2914 domain-containing protein [Gammaproteobacteria bacterium]NIM74357.1 DUF2914 domain-containing protein [Gammaproteobacteria bacterium]NIO26129.1 DUF2914 domain-containing protein [Gammaproteobacteria bacterium]NIO66742.1 DUF2914 domain-containing protein [Gammaproteobacteria bacterium]NIP44994.1 DUF2914 domain-containing protein [Gammaproteobacteria bacterium]
MHLRKTLLTSIAAMIFAIPALVWAGTLEVRDVAISTGVEDRVPTGISSYFDASVGKLYAFTRIVGADGETRIYHKWYHGDVLVADVPLNVRSGDWRTWSSKNVQSDWTGDWRVVVVSEDGSVLGSVKFAVN